MIHIVDEVVRHYLPELPHVGTTWLQRPCPPRGIPVAASQPSPDGIAIPPVTIPELLLQIPLLTRNYKGANDHGQV